MATARKRPTRSSEPKEKTVSAKKLRQGDQMIFSDGRHYVHEVLQDCDPKAVHQHVTVINEKRQRLHFNAESPVKVMR